MDEPTSFPEGTELELVVVGGGDDLGEHDRAQLHAAIDEGMRETEQDETDAADVIAALRSRG